TVFMGIAAPKSTGGVHCREAFIFDPVLRNADGYLFKFPVGFFTETVLGSNFQPAPVVGAGRTVVINRLAGTKGKELTYLRFFGERFGVSHDERFPVPHIPKLLVESG